MGYQVIIAEKPSVAASIAKIVGATTQHRTGPTGYVEGNGYRVTWAFGHLVGLQTPEQMGFDKGILPMFPEQWKTKLNGRKGGDGKEKPDEMAERQMKTIDTLFSNASSIIVATDAGREGELIFRYIYEYLQCRTPFRRLWISSLTDEAISKGMNEVKDGHSYDALSDAAHARSEADWLVGYNASRALRIFTGFRGNLSLGRVQTPTLGMICERYEANKNFVPTPFWVVSSDTEKAGAAFTVLSENRYGSEEQAVADLGKVEGAGRLKVAAVEKKHTSRKPPLLYDLTALQRAANGRYGLTADQTLKTAQSLYEKKYLSYPRTGSRYIPEDVFKTIPELLRKMSAYDGLGEHAANLAGKKLCRKSVNDSKMTDHHALLPTGNIPSGLDATEKKVYEMVVGRMVEAFGEDFEADVTTVTLDGGGVMFKARGSVPTRLGWKAVYGAAAEEEARKQDGDGGDDDDPTGGQLPELREGDQLPVHKAEVLRKTDKPLPIYTDSSLLGEMEICGKKIEDEELRESMKDVGLGTPATRAATIEVLINRNYIVRNAKKLLPTEFGLQIWRMVKGRKIADVKTTGEWEKKLHLIEAGSLDADVFNRDIRSFVREIIEDLRANCVALEGVSTTGEPTRTCPICGRPMRNLQYSVSCDGQSGGCGFRISREIAGKKLPATAIDALAKGKKTALLKGFTSKSGKKFDAALKVDTEAGKVAFDLNAASPVNAGNLKCPKCGGPLKTEQGKVKCGCGFEMWMYAGGQRLSEDQIKSLLEGKPVTIFGLKSKKGTLYNARFRLNADKTDLTMEFVDK